MLVLSQGSTRRICWEAEDEYDVQLWSAYGRKIHEDGVSVVMWGRTLVGAMRKGQDDWRSGGQVGLSPC